MILCSVQSPELHDLLTELAEAELKRELVLLSVKEQLVVLAILGVRVSSKRIVE